MTQRIIVAGATGNLGMRIVKALTMRKAIVVALMRTGTSTDKIESLSALGAVTEVVDLSSVDAVAHAAVGSDCIISAVAGLRGVIVEAQKLLLEAAVRAGVPRFIPSDFCTDFTRLPAGENRNFDLRREFHEILDVAPIAATAIFNGAFAEILKYNIPLLDFKKKTVGYWGDPAHRLDFTTMDDTAAYTAAAALDTASPPALRIASFQVTPNDLVSFTTGVLKTPFTLVCMGTVEELRDQNKTARAAHPEGEHELYSRWQQGQYMQSMFSTTHESTDSSRYPDLHWTSLPDFLSGS